MPRVLPKKLQTFSVGLGRGVRGHFIQKGQRLRLDDPLVKAHPDYFRRPAMRLPEDETDAKRR
jgi:hypothetical protein